MYRLAHINAQQQPEGLAYVAGTLWVGQKAPTLPESDALISGEVLLYPGNTARPSPPVQSAGPAIGPPLPRGQIQASTQEGTLTPPSCFLDQ